jgi:hypothetical protein
MPDDLPAEFDKDTSHSFRDHTSNSICSVVDASFSYCNTDIDTLSVQLGISWGPSKTIPFTNKVSFLGFCWNLSNRTMKYKEAIRVWTSHATHALDNIQRLYRKLLHASLVVPAGGAYLTSLEAMLCTFITSSFVPHHPPKDTNNDTLSSLKLACRVPGPSTITDCGAFSDAEIYE